MIMFDIEKTLTRADHVLTTSCSLNSHLYVVMNVMKQPDLSAIMHPNFFIRVFLNLRLKVSDVKNAYVTRFAWGLDGLSISVTLVHLMSFSGCFT